MKNKLEKYLNSFIKDIENSAPNTKEKLKEIYPVKFKLNLNNYGNIYVNLEKNSKKISLDKLNHIDFEIKASIEDIVLAISSRKIKKELIKGDIELAFVLINTVLKSDIDLTYLIDKYFGSSTALILYFAKKKISQSRQTKINTNNNKIHKKIRELSIKVDRMEASKNL